jgi:hypothetical protein
MLQDRLNSLMFLTIEQEMTRNINPENIIDDFKNST